MRHFVKSLIVCVCLAWSSAFAHDIRHQAPVVIDTDMGLDDAVTLALALQSPRAKIVSIVACEGTASGAQSVENLEQMLHLFNRGDIALFAPAKTSVAIAPPPFRGFAEESVAAALPEPTEPFHRPFSPEAYTCERGPTIVLALGPLTNLAAALRVKPEIKEDISKVIFAGSPEATGSWNVRFDPEALAAVQAAGVPLDYVVPEGRSARKPDAWREGELSFGQGTSIGEGFVKRLLAGPQVRQHYLERFESFHDELVFLYFVDETLFWGKDRQDLLVPNNRAGVGNLFTRLLADGRQGKDRVVLVAGTLPDNVLQSDIRQRKTRIIANNGQAEWFAQLLVNELHEHLGAYSIIGVKMGLRAAELLNAPQHGMQIVSHVPPRPPMSCLNDGLIVSTGCTPGRTLFAHEPSEPVTVAAGFECNGRRVTLTLKAEYRERLQEKFKALLAEHTLEDHEYWHGVRELGLDIWENWHRRELFDVAQEPRRQE
ncbi:MAG: nucleoside hydrolase [Planctomycetes bacterium]|nr:nucleoside hydrolase [Planctomycetota bacterium]